MGGGKSATTTQSVSIPPEVLARYNAVNARAEDVAGRPFQQYSTDPNAFVAPLNSAQLAGIEQTGGFAQAAQPYYQQAAGQLAGAQQQGQAALSSAYNPLYAGYGQGQQYAQMAGQGYANAPSAAYPSFAAAQAGLGAGLDYASALQSGALQQYGQAAGAAAPLQGYGAGAITGATQAAQPAQQYGMGQIMGAQGAAAPMQQYGGQAIANAVSAAAPLQTYGAGAVTQAPQAAAGANQAAMQMGLGAAGLSMPLYQQAIQGTQAGLSAAQPFLNTAQGQIGGAGQMARPLLQNAAIGTQEAVLAADPYFKQATQNLGAGAAAASPYYQTATEGTQAALAAGQPFQGLASQAALAGSQAVGPDQFSQEAIGQYMSPFMSNVVKQTMAAQAQQNAQQRQALTGDAIRAGAFGGDRAGIAQANLAYQQNLANQQTIANLLQGGYGQALGAFQQQQGVNLAAQQANRAAQQNLANQALQIGQQGYGQQMGAAQQMANLGQTQFQQGLAQSQQMAALGQGLYGQKLGAAAQEAGLGQALFGQGITAGQAMAGLGQQAYGQQLGAAQQLAGLGQGMNAQQLANAQLMSQLGQTQFGQQLGAGTAAAQIGQQAFGQQLAAGQAAAQLGQQLFGQQLGTGTAAAQLGQQLFGQQLGAGQAAAQLGQQLYAQNLGGAQFLQGMGAQGFQQQAAAAAQQAGLGQALASLGFQQAQGLQGLGGQLYGMGQGTAAQEASMAQQGYGMGAGTAQALAGLGAGAQAAGLQGAQAMMGAGQIAQQTEQAGRQALYNQFLQGQAYPFQVTQFLGNLAMGTGALSGSTTTTTQPSSFFSDRRIKEGVHRIGETEEGLPIYKFRYKGEDKDQTHIGYMADEVEEKHPDAVGEYGGVKYVDYAKVNARESMGGAVHDGGLGRAAYNPGGIVGPEELSYLRQMAAQQTEMYGGAKSKAGLAGAMPGGVGTYVPQTTTPPIKLVTAGSLPRQQPSGMQQALGTAEQAQKSIKDIVGSYNPKTQKYEGGLQGTISDAVSKAKSMFGSDASASNADMSKPANPDLADSLTDEQKADLAKGLYANGGYVDRHSFREGGAPYGADDDTPYEEADKENRITSENQRNLLKDVVESGAQHIQSLPKPGEPPKQQPSGLSEAVKLGSQAASLGKSASSAIGGLGNFFGSGAGAALDPLTKLPLLGEAASGLGAGASAAAGAGAAAEGAGILGGLGAAGTSILEALPFLAFLSDERTKENKRVVGKLHNGHDVIAYNHPGMPTQIGLGAQHVEEKDPYSVWEDDHGIKYVDYDRATMYHGGEVDRPHYAGGGFEDALKRTLQFEGGYAEDTGGPTMMGISSKANPDVDLQRVKDDPEYRSNIYKTRYWDPIGAEGMDPKMQRIAFDTAVNLGVGRTNELLKQADGDPSKLLTLRQQHYNDLVARDPETYGQYAKGWSNRVNALASEAELPSVGGLGRGRQVAAAQTQPESATGKAASGLGDLLTSSRFWAPVGTGLLTMASSPSRYLGAAALQGLGAGLAAMQPAEAAEAGIERTKEGTRTQKVTTAVNTALLARSAIFGPPGDQSIMTKKGLMSLNVWRSLPPEQQPEPLAYDEAMAAVQRLPAAEREKIGFFGDVSGTGQPGAGAAGTTEPKPGEKPKVAPPPFTLIGNTAKQQAQSDFNLFMKDPTGMANQKAMSDKMEQQIMADAQAAATYGTQLNELSSILLNLPKQGWTSPGVTFEVRRKAANLFNDVLGVTRNADLRLNPEDLGSAAAADKLKAIQSFIQTAPAGQHSLGALQLAGLTVPSTDMPREAIVDVLADNYLKKQQSLDQLRALNEYKKEARTQMGGAKPDWYLAQSATEAFRQDAAQRYGQEKDYLKHFLSSYTDPKVTKEAKPWFSQVYGREASPTYFLDLKYNRPGLRRYIENN